MGKAVEKGQRGSDHRRAQVQFSNTANIRLPPHLTMPYDRAVAAGREQGKIQCTMDVGARQNGKLIHGKYPLFFL